MPRRSKQRSEQHLIDENAQKTLQNLIPPGWVLRNYRPDYGIDYVLEVFQSLPDITSQNTFETLGEHLFIQLKGRKSIQRRVQKIYDRYNIEKAIFAEDKSNLIDELEVVSFPLEVPELVTVQRMGAALPVLLVLVEITTGECFFVCLNDYIEKILIPKHWNGDYATTNTRTIHIPTKNLLSNSEVVERIFGWYAKRAKLFSAFQKINYQRNELLYTDDLLELISLSHHFARILMRYDFWDHKAQATLPWYLAKIRQLLEGDVLDPDFILAGQENLSFGGEPESQECLEKILKRNSIIQLWEGLSALSRVYEETCREWFLPTAHGVMTTYFNDLGS